MAARPSLWVRVDPSVNWCWAALSHNFPSLDLGVLVWERGTARRAPRGLSAHGVPHAWCQPGPELAPKHVPIPSVHAATKKDSRL